MSGGVVAWTSWQPPGGSEVHVGVFTATEGTANSATNPAYGPSQGGPYGGPAGLALNATGSSAFYNDGGDGELVQCTLSGVLASCSDLTPNGDKQSGDDVAWKGGTVYFTNFSARSVYSIPASGGSVTTIASGEAGPVLLALDASWVYWVNTVLGSPGSGNVDRNPQVNPVPAAASNVVASVSGGIGSMATDGKYVYYVVGNNVLYAPAGGGAGKTLYAGKGRIHTVIAVGGSIYLYDEGDSVIRGIKPP